MAPAKKLVLLCTLASILFVSNFSFTSVISRQDPINPDLIYNNQTSSDTLAIFNNQKVSIPDINDQPPVVLGDSSTNDEKRIEVDLTTQRLYAYEGDRIVYSFLISSGKWNRTPTGEFTIWAKVRSQKMSGGSKELGTYYYLPNVPYVMFFYNQKVAKYVGYSFHGTYWHDNFGVPMSHGCINMITEDVRQLYYWANPVLGEKSSINSTDTNPGTKVIIYGKYTGPVTNR